jgi:hypothetical protein
LGTIGAWRVPIAVAHSSWGIETRDYRLVVIGVPAQP